MLKKKNEIVLIRVPFGDRTFAYSGAKVQSPFYPGDLVTRTGDRDSFCIRETPGLSGRVGTCALLQITTRY